MAWNLGLVFDKSLVADAVHYWTMADSSTGLPFADSGTADLDFTDGTASGTTPQLAPDGTTDVHVYAGGSTSQPQTSDPDALEAVPTGDWTVALWFFHTGGAGGNDWFLSTFDGSDDPVWLFKTAPNAAALDFGFVWYAANGVSGDNLTVDSTSTISAAAWQFLAVRYTDATGTVEFFNGTTTVSVSSLGSSTSGPGSTLRSGPVYWQLGVNNPATSSERHDGRLWHIGVWHTALDTDDLERVRLTGL